VIDWDVELLGKLSQRSIALHGGERHLRPEGRCVVPASSSAHSLPIRGHSMPAVRQKLHLSPCVEFRGRLFWRFLRSHKIDLAARKSWCESNDPNFKAKAAMSLALRRPVSEGYCATRGRTDDLLVVALPTLLVLTCCRFCRVRDTVMFGRRAAALS
jgi:hypothetical protein